MPRKNDQIIGQTINGWLVLSRDRLIHGDWQFKCVCPSCKKPTLLRKKDLPKRKTCRSCYLKKITKGCDKLTGNYWFRLIRSAKDRGIPFEITIEYAYELFKKQKGRCKLSGIEISLGQNQHKKQYQTASIDRINNDKGYILGNIQWVHKDINRMKHAFTQEAFLRYCEAVYKESRNAKINS